MLNIPHVSGKWFQMRRPNTLTTSSPNVNWLIVKTLHIVKHVLKNVNINISR